jgi:hypothetical protein
MSERTTHTPALSTPNGTATVELPAAPTTAEGLEALLLCHPLYTAATPEQQAALETAAVEALERGDAAAWLAGLSEYTTAGSYLATLEADGPDQPDDVADGGAGHTLKTLRPLLAELPRYQAATPGQRGCLERDALHLCGEGGEGLGWEEYAEGLAEWVGTTAEYLAESWELAPDGSMHPAPALPAGPELTKRALAFDNAKPMGEAAGPEIAAAMAAEAEAAEEARVKQLRDAAIRELDRGEAAYAKGELAARSGKLAAGGHFSEYVRLQAAAGLQDRSVATRACELAILPYATEKVDVNLLIRAHWAHKLLAGDRGKDKAAVDVPWGHWKAAYSLLLVQADFGTPNEHYVLLPGLEARCLEVFDGTLGRAKAGKGKAGGKLLESRDKTTELCQAVVREYAAQQEQARKAAAVAAQRQADDAQQAAADAKAGREEADREAKAAADKAAAAAAAEKAADDDAARDKAKADREAATREAEKARAAADAKRFAEEQAAREAARTAAEQRQASKQAAEAEAAKAKLDAKAAAKDKAKDPTPAPKPPVPAGEPRINPAGLKDSPAKDVAEMLASIITHHATPTVVLADLLHLLAAMPAGKPFAHLDSQGQPARTHAALTAAVAVLDAPKPAPAKAPAA